ncbi:ribosomal protein L37E [Elusimicrobium posterum]|uniref:hypothetical protein n=1 Tax=Elusimicrobium posterum TaxID=3116653 RepID=UPI003C72E032
MSLIKCSECGRQHSDKAAVCPGCGYSHQEEMAKREAMWAAEEARMEYLTRVADLAKTDYPEDYAKYSGVFTIKEKVIIGIAIIFVLGIFAAISDSATYSSIIVSMVSLLFLCWGYTSRRRNNLEKLAAIVEKKEGELAEAVQARAEKLLLKKTKEEEIVEIAKEVMILKNNYKSENDTGNILKNQIQNLEEQITTLQKEIADMGIK